MENSHMALPPDVVEGMAADRNRVPDEPAGGPLDWIRKNLFSSVGNSIQTVVFSLVLLGALRWLTGLIFADESNWASVWTNLRLLMIYNYPNDQIIRIWFSLGVLIGAASLTMVAFGFSPRVKTQRIVTNTLVTAGIVALLAIVAPPVAPRGAMVLFAVVMAAVGIGVHFATRGRELALTLLQTLLAVSVVLVAVLWLVPFGQYLFVDGESIQKSGTVSTSTKVPWTIMFAILIGAYLLGRVLLTVVKQRVLQLAMVVFWVFGPAFIIFLVLRDPAFDYDHVLSTDLPMALAFIVGGGLILYWLSDPARSELARALAAFALAVAVFHWVAAFFGWYPMLQKARLSFLLLALFMLAVPTFSGERAARLRFAGTWAGLMVILHWLITGINTESTVTVVAPPFVGGFTLTLVLAYYVMLASFPLGVLLSLARTSNLPIFRLLATSYIEAVRGIPLITVLFFFSVMVPLFLPSGMALSELAAMFLGYTLFSSAYMAENVRGGLQSVRKGQFEASDAIGLTTAQRTVFIILPQALRVSIPNIVGQSIATFKETSLVYIVGGFELLRIANQTIPNQPDFLGQNRPALLFISAVYFMFAYTMSRGSRSLETKLGVGTR